MHFFLQKLYFWLFVGDIPTQDHHEYRKLKLLNALLIIISLTILSFSALNAFIFKNHWVASLDFIAGLAALYTYIDLRIGKNLNKAINFGTTILFVFFIILIYTSKNKDFILIWTIFLPIFVMALKGHQQGLIISLLFYALLLPIAYQGIGTWFNDWNNQSFIRFAIASILLTGILYIKESALDQMIQKDRFTLSELKRLSITDTLTGLYNRRYINEKLEEALDYSKQTNAPLSLAILDIDNFKQINDDYGHNHGDLILQEVADLLSEHLPHESYLARWGGEEFLIIFPNQTVDEASSACDRLRKQINQHIYDSPKGITVSFGVAQYQKGCEHNTFIARADSALYKAKQAGRNRVIQHHEVSETQGLLFSE